MQVLRKLPFFDRATVIKIADTTIPIRPYQIYRVDKSGIER